MNKKEEKKLDRLHDDAEQIIIEAFDNSFEYELSEVIKKFIFTYINLAYESKVGDLAWDKNSPELLAKEALRLMKKDFNAQFSDAVKWLQRE